MLENNGFDDIFDDSDQNVCNMKCDIYEHENTYIIELDVPGYDRNSLKIEYLNGYISVMGEKVNNNVIKDRKYLRKERNYGLYKRQFYVGDIDYNKIIAKYYDGMLKITIPKVKENKAKNIIIK